MNPEAPGRYDHYLFGEWISSPGPPDERFMQELLEGAERARPRIAAVSTRELLDLLDRVGRLWGAEGSPARALACRVLPEVVGFSPEMVARGLDELSALLSRSHLTELLRYELGMPEVLDRWTWRPGYGGYMRGEPLGVLLHVSPGNVFLGAVDSLVRGLLTRNVNLLKVSSADPFFPLLFVRTLLESDPQGTIARSLAVFSMPRAAEALEGRLKRGCQGIVVWGGEEAVRSWRRDLPLGCRLVEYGPKMSFALVTRAWLEHQEVGETARALALDGVMWEQRGCGSPQFVFVEAPEGLDPLSQAFMEALARALEALAEEIPPARLGLDEKIEILRERELTRFEELGGAARAWVPLGEPRWSVLWREPRGRLGSPLNRTLVVHPYRRFEEVLGALTPHRDVLQTVGFGALPQEVRTLSRDLARAGADRFTELGRMHRSRPGAPHDGSFQLGRLLRWVSIESVSERFDAGERLHPSEPAPSKTRRLLDLIEFAREGSPFYRERFQGLTVHHPSEIVRLPLLSGEDVRRNTPPEGEALLTSPLRNAYVFASGGSTGAPKFSLYSYEEWEDVTETLAAIYRVAGIDSGDTVGNLFMAGNLWTSFLAASEALEKLGCTSLPIAGNAEIDLVMRYVEMFRPTALLGLPSVLVQIAETVERRGLDLQVRKILYGGEHLSREAKSYLRSRLGAEIVLSAGYASVDAGPIAYQCPHRVAGVHHLLYDSQFLELLDPETSSPVADGEVGEIVVTCLGRRLMPLIRYRTGDLGRRVFETCPCGRQTPLFELKGRLGDVIRVGTVNIYPDDMARALSQVEGVSHLFQIVAEEGGLKDRLLVRAELIRGDGPGDRADRVRDSILSGNAELAEAVRERWLEELTVELVSPGGLPRIQRTGKIRRVVDLRHRRDP